MKSINRSKRMFNLRVYVSRLEVSAKVRLKGMNKTRSWHWANFGPPRARTFLQNVSEHGERTNEMTLDECQIKWAGQKFRRRFGLQPGCFLELWPITTFFRKQLDWNFIWLQLRTPRNWYSAIWSIWLFNFTNMLFTRTIWKINSHPIDPDSVPNWTFPETCNHLWNLSWFCPFLVHSAPSWIHS